MIRSLLCVAVVVLSSSVARADLIQFAVGDGFDEAVVGTNVSVLGGQLTVVSINGSTTPGEHGLETNGGPAGILGIDTDNDGGSEDNDWDAGESLGFSFNFNTAFEGIDFGGMTGSETFTLQSSAFTGLSIGASPSSNVAYDSGSGTFTFSASQPADNFGLSEIGGSAISVGAGDTLTLTYSAGGNDATLQSLSFAAVPEPSGLLLLSAFAAAGALRRRRS